MPPDSSSFLKDMMGDSARPRFKLVAGSLLLLLRSWLWLSQLWLSSMCMRCGGSVTRWRWDTEIGQCGSQQGSLYC